MERLNLSSGGCLHFHEPINNDYYHGVFGFACETNASCLVLERAEEHREMSVEEKNMSICGTSISPLLWMKF